MPRIPAIGGLLGLFGVTSSNQGSTLMRLGTAGVVHAMVREADRRLEERGGSPLAKAINRSKRQAAATVRRTAGRGGVLRSVSRSIGKSARPGAAQRRNMRRESYRRQGESLSDEQLLSIPASELPPELVRRRSEIAARPQGTESAATSGDAAPVPQRAKIDQQLRDIIGDPDKLPPHVRAQLEKQIAEKFAQPSEPTAASQPEAAPQPTPDQRKRENTQAVIDAQLEDRPQPRRERAEGGGGWLDKLQTGLDVTGVADPTPIVDGTNAVISLGRAAVDPERRTEHLQNAAISTVSAVVPYVGDSAKLLKVGRAAKKAHAARGAERAAAGATGAATEGAQSATGQKLRRGVRRVGHGIADMFGGGAAQPPGDDEQREGAPPIADGGTGGAQPPRFGSPSPAPGDDNNSPRRQREDAEGIAAHDKWTEKFKDGALSMASFAGKVYLAIEGLHLLNLGVLAINKDLAQYSGTLANSYARGENADIRRDMKKAQALAGPLSHLQHEESKLADTMSELLTPIQGTLIEILARVTQLANLGIEVVKDLTHLGILSDIYSWLVGKDDGAPGGREFLQDLSDGKFDGFGIDDLGKRFELLDKKTRDQLGLTPATKRPTRGKTP